jgi:hypothetical protein
MQYNMLRTEMDLLFCDACRKTYVRLWEGKNDKNALRVAMPRLYTPKAIIRNPCHHRITHCHGRGTSTVSLMLVRAAEELLGVTHHCSQL